MRKSIVRYGSILCCSLMLMPNIGLADEDLNDDTIDEVVVTSTPLDKYLVTTSVITAEEIEAKGARNVADALSNMSGIDFQRGRKNTNTLVIRGVGASYLKVYIDGVLVNGLSRTNANSEVDLNQYPVDNIAKIEVIKGPAPVTYGVDAIGGMILITTKDGRGFSGTKLSLSGGSNGTFNTNISVGGSSDSKKFDYFISGGTESTSGYTDNADQRGYHFNAKLNWRLTDDSLLTFIGAVSHLNKYIPDRYDYRTGKIVSSRSGFWPGLNKWQYKDWDKTTLSLNYQKKFNDKFDMDMRIFRYTEDQGLWAHGSNYDPAAVTPNANGIAGSGSSAYSVNRWNLSPWESTVKGFEWGGNYKANKIHTLSFGFLYHNIDWASGNSIDPQNRPSDPDYLTWDNTGRNNKRYGYYLQDNIVPNDRTMITLGLRHDKSAVTDSDGTGSDTSSTNPTVNVVYKLNDKSTMRAAYGKTISFPLLSQYFGTYANPNLKPEKSTNYEIGLKHEFNTTTSGDIAFFQNDIKDRIARTTRNAPYENLDSTKIKGVEIGLSKQISRHLKAYTNYTFLDTETNNLGVSTKMPYVPKHHFNYGLEYNWDNGYKLNLSGHWVTQRYTDDSGGDTRDASLGEISYISGYHTMDMKLTRQVNQSLSWHFTVFNLFDKEYEDSLFVLAPGRTFLAGVDCKF